MPMRPAIVLLFALAVAGCGFQPLYGSEGDIATAGDLARVDVARIPDRSGQILRNILIEGLNPSGRPTDPLYRLEVEIAERKQGLGISKEDDVTRANLVVTASVSLLSTADGEQLLSRQLGTITSYNILLDEYATLSAEQAARDRALRRLGRDIRTQLALYFARSG